MPDEQFNPQDPVHDRSNYRLGLFYYCKSDKRLMPAKHFPGSGWEINYAHPKAVWLMVAFLVGGLLIAILCIGIASWLM